MEAHHQAMEARQQLETDTQPAAKQWTTFLSHHKKDGGSTAKHFRKTFEQRLDGKHYLDVDELTNITVRKLMTDVRSADVLVLLLTDEVMTRPWCLVEIHTALAHGIPIVPIQLGKSHAKWPDAAACRAAACP